MTSISYVCYIKYDMYDFLSNHNIHKSLYGLYLGGLRTLKLIDFYQNLLIKGSEAQKKAKETFMKVVI